MTLPLATRFPDLTLRPPTTFRELSEELQNQVRIDTAITRTLFQELTQEWGDLKKFRDYYNGEQSLVFGSEKFKEFFPNFKGFEDNWCQVVIDAVADKIKLIGIDLDSSEEEDNEVDSIEENPLSKRIWDVLRDNDIDEQQGDLTEGTLVEGRAAVIVWPDEILGARVDWNPAQLIKVRYSEEDYKKIDFAVKRWETPAGEIRVNVYDDREVRKYVESRTNQLQDPSKAGIAALIPDMAPSQGLQPRFTLGESWPLPHDFKMVPVVEFLNKRGSELSDVIPLQDAINYLITAGFIAADFNAVKQKVFFTHLKAPVGGWKSEPGRVWHLAPMVDSDGKITHGMMDQFDESELGQYRTFVEMILQHLALTSKTPVRMFFKSDRSGRGDAPSGESQLVEDEPLLDKCDDRETRMGNKWFQVVKLIAKALGENGPIRGEMVWQDHRSKYRSALLDEAIKLANAKAGLGLPIHWVVKRLGLSPEELVELQAMLKAQEKEQEQLRQEQMAVAGQQGNGDTSQLPSSDE